jgi:hypothetical protein
MFPPLFSTSMVTVSRTNQLEIDEVKVAHTLICVVRCQTGITNASSRKREPFPIHLLLNSVSLS